MHLANARLSNFRGEKPFDVPYSLAAVRAEMVRVCHVEVISVCSHPTQRNATNGGNAGEVGRF